MLDRIENVCRAISDRLDTRGSVSDELLNSFCDIVTEAVGDDDDCVAAIELENVKRLSKLLDRVLVYGRCAEVSSETAARIGACWAGISILNKKAAHQSRIQGQAFTDELIQKHRNLLLSILDEPGQSHKSLAASLDMSPSRLTQIVSQLKGTRLLSISIFGREKRYYLSPSGRSTIEALKRAAESQLRKEAVTPRKVTFDCVRPLPPIELSQTGSSTKESVDDEYKTLCQAGNSVSKQLEAIRPDGISWRITNEATEELAC